MFNQGKVYLARQENEYNVSEIILALYMYFGGWTTIKFYLLFIFLTTVGFYSGAGV